MNDSPLHPYPWQRPPWERLMERVRRDRLPHALLITGPAGIGKRHLAATLAQALLCEQPASDGTACGRCRGCTLFRAGSHPDYQLVEPVEEGKALTVDQVRGLSRFQALKGQYSERRIGLLTPADRLNMNAANALLKTLEEPTGGTLLLLCSARPAALPATVRSRCQRIELPPASAAEAGEWLQARLDDTADAADLLALSGGAPLRAVELAAGEALAVRDTVAEGLMAASEGRAGSVALAEQWHQAGAESVLRWLFLCLADMIRLRSAGAAARLSNPDLADRLHTLAEKVDLKALYRTLDLCQRGIRLAEGQTNRQLLLEEIVITWAHSCRMARR